MRKIITVICLVALLAIGVRGAPLSPADVKTLLERIREKRAAAPSMQADFQEQRKVHLLDEPINSGGKIWFQAPNKFRVERKGNAPSITVSDGQQLWIYYPNFNQPSIIHWPDARRLMPPFPPSRPRLTWKTLNTRFTLPERSQKRVMTLS